MGKELGMVIFSFALREREPNPCNLGLANAAERIARRETGDLVTVAQWEVAAALERRRNRLNLVLIVGIPDDGSYLDSSQVWEAAAEEFRKRGITEVIPVAQPFLQMRKVKQLIRESGFKVAKRKIGWIGFDPDSIQPWTRGPLRLLVYAVRQRFSGARGFKGKQAPA